MMEALMFARIRGKARLVQALIEGDPVVWGICLGGGALILFFKLIKK